MYRPLPNSVTIKDSDLHGLGLFATEDIPKNTILGKIYFEHKGNTERTHFSKQKNWDDNL